MSGEVKLMRMPDFLKRKSSNGMIGEFLRDNFMLVRKFYCIGLVSDFFAEKLLSKWEGHFIIEEVYRSGAINIASLKDKTTQVVNGQRLKHYISGDSLNKDIDIIQVVTLEEFIKEKVHVKFFCLYFCFFIKYKNHEMRTSWKRSPEAPHHTVAQAPC
jgi:hypothetical protein